MGHTPSLAEAAMTTKRKLFVVIAILVAAFVVAIVMWPDRSAINAENAAKIQAGMDLATVEELLGGPARDESTGPLAAARCDNDKVGRAFLCAERVGCDVACSEPSEWVSNTAVIFVDFDEGRVRWHACMPVRRVYQSPWTMLRRYLRI
jgi:hypothetical protein